MHCAKACPLQNEKCLKRTHLRVATHVLLYSSIVAPLDMAGWLALALTWMPPASLPPASACKSPCSVQSGLAASTSANVNGSPAVRIRCLSVILQIQPRAYIWCLCLSSISVLPSLRSMRVHERILSLPARWYVILVNRGILPPESMIEFMR